MREGKLDSDPLKRVEYARLQRELRFDAVDLKAAWTLGADGQPAYQLEGQGMYMRRFGVCC